MIIFDVMTGAAFVNMFESKSKWRIQNCEENLHSTLYEEEERNESDGESISMSGWIKIQRVTINNAEGDRSKQRLEFGTDQRFTQWIG